MRKDDRYSHPIMGAFQTLNKAYIDSKVKQNRVDQHWEAMIEELLEDKKKGRVTGPLQSPSGWTHKMVTVQDLPLLPLPDGEVFASGQLPIQDIHRPFTMVNTPRGFTLWRHNCLSFGASGSVWSFNRFADMIQFIARKLLLIPCHHFVDDFAAFEPRPIATSGFQSFNDLFATLGLQIKAKKAASPGPKHKLLGVIVSIDSANITLEPCRSRCDKLLQTIQSARNWRANLCSCRAQPSITWDSQP